MGDFEDNIFLKAAMGGKIQIPKTSSSSTITSTSTSSASSSPGQRSKAKPKKANASHGKYSNLEDQLILKAVEVKGRDWRAVLAFLK